MPNLPIPSPILTTNRNPPLYRTEPGWVCYAKSAGKPSLFDLAASYCSGIVKNHPFIDGNKRAGFLTAILFLELNDCTFHATEVEAALRTLALAAGEMSEVAYAKWSKENSKCSF